MRVLSKSFAKAQAFRLPILAGILIGTSYIPFPPWAGLFGFVPLWLFFLRQTNTKSVFWGGWWTQFILTLIGFNWVAHTVHEFGHLPWPAAVVTLLLFGFFFHLYIPIAGVIWFLLKSRLQLKPLASILLLGLLTAATEAVMPMLFPWNFAYTWYWIKWPIYQVAEYIGFQGLSTLLILINSTVLLFWLNRREKKGQMALAAGVATFLALSLAGWVIERGLKPGSQRLTVGMVQPNIGNMEKQYAETGPNFRQPIMNQLFELTENLLKQNADRKFDFVIWPETAFPDLIGSDIVTFNTQSLVNFIRRVQVPIVTGAYGRDFAARKLTNSLFVLNQNAQYMVPHYSKTILLAFGEYFPGAEYYPQLKTWFPDVADFARGPGPTVIDLNGLKIGAQICYEGLYPEFTRGLAEKGAEVLVNVTNDSWYGTWQEPYQHMMMTFGRSVESRLPLVRVTNTGISSVVLASGEILTQSPMEIPWSMAFDVPYEKNPPLTFYQKYFWLLPTLLGIAMLGIVIKGRNERT